jgi:hypothetical protein
MCHFITATLPRGVKPELVAPIFESHKLGFQVLSNPHIAEQLDPGDSYVLTTRGHCDCGTVLGSLNQRTGGPGANLEREVERFRKHGWSEAKIQRWREQKDQARERRLREEEAHGQANAPLADQWVRFITALLESGRTPRAGILLHLYRRNIESERIRVSQKERVELVRLTPQMLMEMREDVLYEFVT